MNCHQVSFPGISPSASFSACLGAHSRRGSCSPQGVLEPRGSVLGGQERTRTDIQLAAPGAADLVAYTQCLV